MSKYIRLLTAVLALAGLCALWGCPKKTEVAAAAPGAQHAATPAPVAKQESMERAQAAPSGLQPVYFDYDQALIRNDAKPAMKADAEWLKAHPKDKMVIEGNCDERGTKEYNLALGRRRAAAARHFLAELGVSGRRISLISYGKEKPLCSELSESCWQKNRRDDFVLARR